MANSKTPELCLLDLAEIYCITEREREASKILRKIIKIDSLSDRAYSLLGTLAKPTRKISLGILVKDAQESPKYSILENRALFHETVVLDLRTSEEKCEIAHGLATRIKRLSGSHDLSKAMNTLVTLASGDYILLMHADESFDKINLNRFLALKWKLRSEKKSKAFLLNVKSSDDGVSPANSSGELRLFPNIKRIRFGGSRYPKLLTPLSDLGVTTHKVDIWITRPQSKKPTAHTQEEGHPSAGLHINSLVQGMCHHVPSSPDSKKALFNN